MNANEREWESLSTIWRAPEPEIERAPLRRLVASHRRRLAAVAACEVLMVAAFLWLSWLLVRDGLVLLEAVWLSTLWIFTAIAAPIAWWNRRGSWDSLAETVAEFRRQRAERWRRTLYIACGLFVAEVIVVIAELVWFDRFTTLAAGFLVVFSLAFGAWVFWMRRRVAADLAAADGEP